MDEVVELLFKFRPVVFEKGRLAFAGGASLPVLGTIAAVLALVAALTYRRVRASSTPRDRIALTSLRVALLALVLLCLARPVIVLSAAVPQRNVVGIVLDDSRSMQVADGGRSRGEIVRQALGGPDSAMYRALAEKFALRFYRLSGGGRVADPSAMAFDGSRSELGPALDGARQDLEGVPVSGLVLVSDGADDGRRPLDESLLSLRARGLPVYTVGVGRERFAKDVEVTRVEMPGTVLMGSAVVATVVVTQRGFGGKAAKLLVEDGGRVVATPHVPLAADGDASTVRVRVPADDAGARTLTFRIPGMEGEQVEQNNARQSLLVVDDRRDKILYIEGEPRFELAFARRALEDDRNVQLVGLQRTAEHKYLRLGVDDSLELASGFPRTRDELYSYRAVVIGSIEASAFTLEQLRMLADFVSVRGGGLLALGGRKSLAEGGWAATPIADVLPVQLQANAEQAVSFAELRIAVTPAGESHPVTQIAAGEQESRARWATLPALTTVNHLGAPKAGATVLLRGSAGEGATPQTVLAWQRYGRGKAAVLAVQDSWLWQMHAEVKADDPTHETFWRQLMRWLASDAPGRVMASASTDRATPGERVTLRADVADSTYGPINGASVLAEVRAPSGATTEVPMQWALARDGEYAGEFVPSEEGVHSVVVRSRAGADSLASAPAYLRSAESGDEYFGAEMRSSVLRRIAQETGGRYYTPETMSALPNDLVYSQAGSTTLREMDLWDMPAMFLMLMLLASAEWGYRRWRGLA